jgi:hypothetical protein
MRVPFKAFADDSIIRGELELEGERLSDFIARDDRFQGEHLILEALDDSRTVTARVTTIDRHDFVAFAGSGPRGNAALRVRTRAHAVRAQAGPYEVVGYLHGPPSAHPFAGLQRRRVLPVTSAIIWYRIAGRRVEEAHDVLLMNSEKIDWLRAASEDDLRVVKALEMSRKIHARAKDMTGELRP